MFVNLGIFSFGELLRKFVFNFKTQISVSHNSCLQSMYTTLKFFFFKNFGWMGRYLKGKCSVFKNNFLLWMKTMHYPNTIRSHLVTMVPMAPFTPKSTSKFRSALHIRYSIVIPRFISRANTAQS